MEEREEMYDNYLSFIGTPLEVEDFRLSCRAFAFGTKELYPFTFNGVAPLTEKREALQKWGVEQDALFREPDMEVSARQITVAFLTARGVPERWARAVHERWPKAKLSLISFTTKEKVQLLYTDDRYELCSKLAVDGENIASVLTEEFDE